MTPAETPDPALLLEPDAIREALAGVRPDPDAFRAGVARKIAERESEEREREARLAAAPPRLRWAASILPPGVVGGAAAMAGVAGKKIGLKAIPGLMAIPAVATLMVVLTFFGALRSLRTVEGPSGEGATSDQEALTAWWRRHRTATLVSVGVLVALVILRHSEVVTLLLLLSMVAMTLQLGVLGRAGFGDRERFGKLAAKLLFWVAWLWFMLRDLIPSGPAGLGALAGTTLLCLGGIACLVIGGTVTWSKVRDRIWHPERRMLYPDPITTFCLRGLYGFFAIGATGVFGLALAVNASAFLSLDPPRAKLMDWVEQFDEPVGEYVDWERYGRVARHLAADGGTPPQLEDTRAAVRRALDDDVALDPIVLVAAASETGPLTFARAAEQVSPSDRRRLLRRARRIDRRRDPAWIRILGASGELSADEVESLLGRLAASWPEPGEHGALEEMRTLAELLDLLGASHLADARAPDVHDALRLAWYGTHDGSAPSFFARSAERAEEDPRPALLSRREIWHSEIEPTLAAVELMNRFGAPAEIDLVRLRVDLRVPPDPEWESWWRYDSNDALVDLARVRLEELAPAEPGGPIAALIRYRVLLGALLLVVLCVVATGRAPRREEAA